MVKEVVASTPAEHPVRSYLRRATDMQSDGALVDTFLHARARSYTVADCLDLVSAAGLAFQGWFHKTPYYPYDLAAPVNGFQTLLNELPDTQLWSVMERLQTGNGTHFFLACRPERPKEDYAIDFSAPESLDYVPLTRTACLLSGDEIVWPSGKLKLNPAQLPFVQLVDGRRTIREIIASVVQQGDVGHENIGPVQEFGHRLFRALWRLDFLAMALNTNSGRPK